MHRVNDPLSLSLPVSMSLYWRVSFHITTSEQGATAEIVKPAEGSDCVDHAPLFCFSLKLFSLSLTPITTFHTHFLSFLCFLTLSLFLCGSPHIFLGSFISFGRECLQSSRPGRQHNIQDFSFFLPFLHHTHQHPPPPHPSPHPLSLYSLPASTPCL